jgi:hypothetical protein
VSATCWITGRAALRRIANSTAVRSSAVVAADRLNFRSLTAVNQMIAAAVRRLIDIGHRYPRDAAPRVEGPAMQDEIADLGGDVSWEYLV